MKKVYGYARVSSRDQNEMRQIAALSKFGVKKTNIFVDKQSGKDFERPMYRKLIAVLKPEDVMFVQSIDRLGRNYEEIIEQWQLITKEKKADIAVIDMPILDTRKGKDLMGTFLSDIVLAILSYVAENERINIRQRQAEGIAVAKANGVRFGARPMELPENYGEISMLWANRKISLDQAAKMCGMSRSTFYSKARNLRNN